jgi:hypothetical protein
MNVREAEAALQAAIEKAARKIVLEHQTHVVKFRCYTADRETGCDEILAVAKLFVGAGLRRAVVSVGAWPRIEQLRVVGGDADKSWQTTAVCQMRVLKGT